MALWSLWKTRVVRFPRSGGRGLGVHGSGRIHRSRGGALGRRLESAAMAQHRECLMETCASRRPTGTDIQWGVASDGQYKGDAVPGRSSSHMAHGGDVSTYTHFVGIDWGSREHVLCVVSADGQRLGERRVAHTVDAVQAAIHWVLALTGARRETIAVGIERPDGVLVDTWLEQQFPLFAINPKQLDRFRDRFTAGGAKDDSRDAHVTADALRTDLRAFRPLQPADPAVVQLRTWAKVREDLQTQLGRLANQLREALYRVDAPWLSLSPAADEPWLWTMLAAEPHPDRWRRLDLTRLAAILQQHRIRRMSADLVLSALQAGRLSVAAGVADAVAAHVGILVPQLQLLHAQARQTEQQIDHWIAMLAAPDDASGQPRQHRDVRILQSLPGVGRIVTATMLTTAAGPLAARDYPTLRALGGTAPITKRSGKRLHIVQMRYACNAALRNALFHWASVSIQHDAPARAYYDQLRQRGHTHGRALRSVADRWLRILVAMLRTQTPYDASRVTRSPIAA